ncbi:hypothetical protein SKAU_G00330480 [Synaphobranchus kaupii]|uniref:DDE Tnp4 domain-containing protein n=1 Tax=Synaphobranchus kaupii TaxID=118154 RepID=A0A9Q1EQH8_SYNKA|nr:hypothetical protein SKAU_G00330480 [Synaphobranchus kaupii]
MNREKKLLAVALLYLRRKRRRLWVHSTLQRRRQLGEFHRLVLELRLDGHRFQRYFRLDCEQFDRLLATVGPLIARADTTYRQAIPQAERLAICLRFLATGDSYRSIASSYRTGISTVASIVPSVARAIWSSLVANYMPVPREEDWCAIAEGFRQRWNFPNCMGSIDGKHMVIQAPPNSGSAYHNYKGTFSIVLLAVVDARYLFRVVDVGAYGRQSDGGTLANSAFGKALVAGTLNLPGDHLLPGAEYLGAQPHVFVADEAFPLQRHLMRPFPGSNLPHTKRVFNYRLSRARMAVECTFGILAAQWRLYRRVVCLTPRNVEACVKATCVLHNFLRWTTRDQASPLPDRVREGREAQPPGGMLHLHRVGSNNATREAMRVRETYTSYFCSALARSPCMTCTAGNSKALLRATHIL